MAILSQVDLLEAVSEYIQKKILCTCIKDRSLNNGVLVDCMFMCLVKLVTKQNKLRIICFI